MLFYVIGFAPSLNSVLNLWVEMSTLKKNHACTKRTCGLQESSCYQANVLTTSPRGYKQSEFANWPFDIANLMEACLQQAFNGRMNNLCLFITRQSCTVKAWIRVAPAKASQSIWLCCLFAMSSASFCITYVVWRTCDGERLRAREREKWRLN